MPTEIQRMIFDDPSLSPADTASLLLTCKAIQSIVRPLLYKQVPSVGWVDDPSRSDTKKRGSILVDSRNNHKLLTKSEFISFNGMYECTLPRYHPRPTAHQMHHLPLPTNYPSTRLRIPGVLPGELSQPFDRPRVMSHLHNPLRSTMSLEARESAEQSAKDDLDFPYTFLCTTCLNFKAPNAYVDTQAVIRSSKRHTRTCLWCQINGPPASLPPHLPAYYIPHPSDAVDESDAENDRDTNTGTAARAKPRASGCLRRRGFKWGGTSSFVCAGCKLALPVSREAAQLSHHDSVSGTMPRQKVEEMMLKVHPSNGSREIELRIPVGSRRWCKRCWIAILGFWDVTSQDSRWKML